MGRLINIIGTLNWGFYFNHLFIDRRSADFISKNYTCRVNYAGIIAASH
jgi:hypothetical protein